MGGVGIGKLEICKLILFWRENTFLGGKIFFLGITV